MAELNLVYKMIVLKMLDMSDFELSNSQVTDFFLDNEYTDYFNVQTAISELVSSDMLNVLETHGNTRYSINDEGKKTLELFSDKITDEIVADIKEYYKQNKLEMREENDVVATYVPLSTGGFRITCKLNTDGKQTFACDCDVSSEAQAQAMCNNWRAKYEELYFEFLDKLTN